MKLNFILEDQKLFEGVSIICDEYGFELGADGIEVFSEKSQYKLEVSYKAGKAKIKYKEKIHFFRGLGLLLEKLKSGSDFEIVEEPQFSSNGAMFDVSRNAVLKASSIKKLIRTMAVMGLNMLMLYTEDTYKIKEQPYFGYMRGGYTYEELKACDDYGDIFGIELVPCIQTLAHIEQFLKWNTNPNIKDTRDVLLSGSEDTYVLIEQMLKAASAPFRSRRIHIGMDEAFGMGRGKYLDINGQENRFSIISRHLKKVTEISKKLGLDTMMWSDMFFVIGSKTGAYYDLESEINEETKKEIPSNTTLVYWDYYHNDENFYNKFIKKHKQLQPNPIFAGGAWTWLGIGTNYGLSFIVGNSALTACKKQQVKEVFITVWGDDGTENNLFSALPGLQLYAEHGYHEKFDLENYKQRLLFSTGISYDAFMSLKYLDEVPGVIADNAYFDGAPSNPSKFLLWQDILLGLFDKHVDGLNISKHYAELKLTMKTNREMYGEFLFDVPEKLCSVLELKSELGLKLKKAYDIKNFEEIEFYKNSILPELMLRVEELKTAHRKQWFQTNKPFGYEVLDLKYGGVIARIGSTIERLDDFINNRVERIEELEEERLYFDGRERPSNEYSIGCSYQYLKIASPGAFYHALDL